MSNDTVSSVRALRTEAELTRARLTGTVEDLRTQVSDTATDLKERLSPSAIKAEVTDYVRDSRDQIWHSIEQKARDNPIQAVAVGAALAYPALQLIRAMPAPLLLVGAGILLSRAGTNVLVAEGASTVKAQTQSAVDRTSNVLDSATHTASRKLSDAQASARGRVDAAMETASSAASSIADGVSAAAGDVKSVISETTDNITAKAAQLSEQARGAVAGTWDQQPLLIAGIGLAIGAFIAAALPSTRVEESAFGEASDALRRQAEALGAKGVDGAKAVVDSAAVSARTEGLTPDGLSKLGETLTDKVRAVAERGVEAAFAETKPINPGISEGKQS